MEQVINALDELRRWLQAYKLLEKIYLELGAYRHDKISDETWREVLIYFKFDDSE